MVKLKKILTSNTYAELNKMYSTSTWEAQGFRACVGESGVFTQVLIVVIMRCR